MPRLVGLSDRLANAAIRIRGHRPRFVPTRVGRVHVVDVSGRGSLPTVVVLHGFSAAGAHYAPLIFRLAPHVRRVLAPDMPAHGLSDVPDRLEPNLIREGLFEALDRTIEEPAILVGNSMGGLAAVRYASARPDNVRGLLLVSPAGGQSTKEELSQMERLFEVPSHRAALDFVDRLFPERGLLRHAYAAGIRRKFHKPLMRRLLKELEAEMLDARTLRGLTMPIRVIWGQADRIFPESHRVFFRENLPAHARFDEPVDFGHAPFLDRPDALTERIVAFIKQSMQAPL